MQSRTRATTIAATARLYGLPAPAASAAAKALQRLDDDGALTGVRYVVLSSDGEPWLCAQERHVADVLAEVGAGWIIRLKVDTDVDTDRLSV